MPFEFFFLFSFSFLSRFLDGLPKVFLGKFHHSLPKKRVTKVGLILLDTLKKVCVAIVEDVICDVCGLCFTLFTVTSIHSIPKVTKIKSPETKWKVTQKIQLFKAQKTVEGNTENSTVQGTKNSEVELISSKVWRKRKEKVFKRKNWLIHSVKVMLILLLKNLFHYQKI